MNVNASVCLASLTMAILSLGCAVQTYPGPELPRDETARITAGDARIISIDGRALPAGRAFMLRFGVRAVSATGVDAGGHSIGLMTLCLAAEGGANYQVRLSGVARTVPEIYDLDRASVVPTLLAPIGQDCAPSSEGSTLVALVPSSLARVHRGVPPHDPWDDPQTIRGPFAWQMLVELPLRIVWGTLYCIASGL